MRFNRR